MLISMIFVQRFDTYLAEQYSLKAFTRSVLAIVKDEPLYFYGKSDFAVTFYANKRIPEYNDLARREASRVYLLCWESDWKGLRQANGLSIRYASDAIDRQWPEHGRLYLISIDGLGTKRIAKA